MKLYLTSVASCLDSIDSFKNLINEHTRLVILPFSYHKDYINCADDVINHFDRDISNKNSIYWSTVKPFIDSGINTDKITIINQYVDTIEYIKYKLTRPNTIIYLPGGFPENIVENIYKYDLIKTIRQCEIIVGESAGSMAPFTDFFVYKDQDYPCYDRFKGLCLLSNATLIPHFDLKNKNILIACKKFSKYKPRTKIYCIADGGYLAIDNGKIIEYNKTYVYKKRIHKRFKNLIKLN